MEEENLLVETVAKIQVTFSAAMFPVLKRMEGTGRHVVIWPMEVVVVEFRCSGT